MSELRLARTLWDSMGFRWVLGREGNSLEELLGKDIGSTRCLETFHKDCSPGLWMEFLGHISHMKSIRNGERTNKCAVDKPLAFC